MALIEKSLQIEPNVGEVGLSCTAEGVSLAGVPLLRRTVTGLAPRPMVELGALLKCAYGHHMDPTRTYPGLDVIAQALNKGDVGRAMVAAIHLKLPDLNAIGAAHIARADEALSKYDANEPRDERGRWTSDGGSSPSSSATPAIRSPDFGSGGMKPILVSGPLDPFGVTAKASLLTNTIISHQCVSHAREPRFFEKTQACALVMEQCSWLVQANGENSLRSDACIWPDGAAAIMKGGILVPFRPGHPF